MACPKSEAVEHPDPVLFCQISLCLYTGRDVQLTPVSPDGLSAGDSFRSYDPSLYDKSNKDFHP